MTILPNPQHLQLPAAVLFESEESLLKDAAKRQQKFECASEAAAALRHESGYFFEDPFLDRCAPERPYTLYPISPPSRRRRRFATSPATSLKAPS